MHRKFGGENLTETMAQHLTRTRPHWLDLPSIKRRGVVGGPVHELAKREIARDIKEYCFKVAASRASAL